MSGRKKLPGDWQSCVDAARRQGKIAEYHLAKLRESLEPVPEPDDSGKPPIEVQAHFEAVVLCFCAVRDKIAQAINSKLRLHANGEGDLMEKVCEETPEFKVWRENPLQKDVAKIRVGIAHYSYGKVPYGLGWKVQDVGGKYKEGSRELRDYAQAAIHHANKLIDLIPTIEYELSRRGRV